MLNHKRLPRKVKKQLKKNSAQWQEYLEKKKIAQEKHESLNVIFNRDYNDGKKVFRMMVQAGR